MTPTEIRLHQVSNILEVSFDNGHSFKLPAEYLRVYSPSAEVRGHGNAEPKLVTGKAEVAIVGLEPVGQYAIKIIFSDGHQSGLYGWEYLYTLGSQYAVKWQAYLDRLDAALQDKG